jgi:hypothetical protein
MKKVCVYCGSKTGQKAEYSDIAQQLGLAFARNNIEMIYGGGRVGIMGIIADAVLEANGYVQGIIPISLMRKEVGHNGLQKLHVTEDMHSRKALMEKLSDAFVVLPGGFGTLDEMFEIITWRQLGFHKKPVLILNSDGYFDDLLNFIQKAESEGFIHSDGEEIVQVTQTVEEVIRIIQQL